MENKDYTLDELRLMAMYLGDYTMPDGYTMKVNTIKEGLDVTYSDGEDEYQFILPHSKEKVIVIEENMLPAYYEGFFCGRYASIDCMTLEYFNNNVASIETVMESLGIYNREFLEGEEEFFAVAKLIEGNKISNRNQATDAMKKLQDANELYNNALKTNTELPLALDKYREEVYRKTRDLLSLIITRFDFYSAIGDYETCSTPATVKQVELANNAYKDMLDLHGRLETHEDKLRTEYYDKFKNETEMEIKLYDGTSKKIKVAGDMEDNVACINEFFKVVEDCRNNAGDSSVSKRVIEVLSNSLKQTNEAFANNENLQDEDLQKSREMAYNETIELLNNFSESSYNWIRGQFNNCVEEIKSGKINSLAKAEELRFKLINVNNCYASVLYRQHNDYENSLRDRDFLEAVRLVDSAIAKFNEPVVYNKEEGCCVELIAKEFYKLANVSIEVLSKEDLEIYEDRLVTVNKKYEEVINQDKERNALRAKTFRGCMIRIADTFEELEKTDNNEPALEDPREEEDLEIFTEQLIRGFAESVGIDLGSIRVYRVDEKPKHKPSKREQRIKQIIGNLEASKEALEKLLSDRTLVSQHIEEVKMLIGSVDFKELKYYEETVSSPVEKSLLSDAQKVKNEVNNLIETFNNGIESLKIQRF